MKITMTADRQKSGEQTRQMTEEPMAFGGSLEEPWSFVLKGYQFRKEPSADGMIQQELISHSTANRQCIPCIMLLITHHVYFTVLPPAFRFNIGAQNTPLRTVDNYYTLPAVCQARKSRSTAAHGIWQNSSPAYSKASYIFRKYNESGCGTL